MNNSDNISNQLLLCTYTSNFAAIDFYLNKLLSIINSNNFKKDELLIIKQNLIRTKKIIQDYKICANRVIKVNVIISKIDSNIPNYHIFNGNWQYEY